MKARATFLGHPIHQMLIVFPLGLLGTSIVFDIMYLITDSGRWADIAYWMIAVGLITGLVAAVFGVIDWTAIPSNTRARKIGLLHGGGNVVVVLLFGISWLLRRDDPQAPELLAILLAFAGVALALVTGWLGGELVDRLSVGVDEGANVNAPSSLTHNSAVGGR